MRGTYVSGVHKPRMSGIGSYFFALSQRRVSPDGQFNGIISIAVLPDYFESFYARMARATAAISAWRAPMAASWRASRRQRTA